MKIEKRGKYGGVKVHLDAEECEMLLSDQSDYDKENFSVAFVGKMGKKIRDLLNDEPDLLKDRTQEEVIAILAKESEKAALQLQAAKQGSSWEKIDPTKLQQALMKHVK